MNGLTVNIASVGRNGTHIYEAANNDVVVGTLTQEGFEGIVQPHEVNGRVFIKTAMGVDGWVEKRRVKFLKQLNITLLDE